MYDLIVIGAGAAGCFSAIRLAERLPGVSVCILEAAKKSLGKVEISGGGRCNVTHACFDPASLIHFYPRGHEQLLMPFTRYQPRDMIAWLRNKGIQVKQESDGRMFPVSDDSRTIINCFLQQLDKHKIGIRHSTRAMDWQFDADKKMWDVSTSSSEVLQSKFLLLSAGSDHRSWEWLKHLGHRIVPPVPSLFTFNIKDKLLNDLMGISMPDVRVSIKGIDMYTQGPVLITHWGLSGPAVLKMSAWAARALHEMGYVYEVALNWMGQSPTEDAKRMLQTWFDTNPKKQIHQMAPAPFPSRLWKYLCLRADIQEKINASELGKKKLEKLAEILTSDTYLAVGKSTYKEEFVTAGGVDMDEISIDTFESNIQPHLYMAGEILNIDGVTGGFNFQAAWTEAEIIAEALANRLG